MSLSTTIKSIQDIMRKDVGVDGDAQRIGQLVWILFLKIWDDRESELELLDDDFRSPLVDVSWTDAAGERRTSADLRWRAWAADPEGETGDKLLGFVNDTLFPALKGLEPGPRSTDAAAEALRRRRALVRAVFEDAYQYMKSGTLLRQVLNTSLKDLPLLKQAAADPGLFQAVVFLTLIEIGVVIKARRLFENPRSYVDADGALSRFHGILKPAERRLIMNVYERYNKEVYEDGGQLDVDDIAITALSKLRTPLWGLQRKQRGFDYVFVDEAQLYNENERRIFPFLTKKHDGHLPIAIALDEAQNIAAAQTSGFAALGLKNLQDESLRAVYRCSEPILRLAFNVIQRTTDLFGAEFPDFTQISRSCRAVDDGAAPPKPLLFSGRAGETLGATVRAVIVALRSRNVRRIGVVVHADRYYDGVRQALADLPALVEVNQRGLRLDQVSPLVALMPPRFCGGQEFDAVVAVGIEQGVVPPSVMNEGLAVSLEQQALRELYLSFTRAKAILWIVNTAGSVPSPLLKPAISAQLIETTVPDV